MKYKTKKKNIPLNITFSRNLLRIPQLTHMGIPEPLSAIAYVISHVDFGYWVDRGDLLVTYKLVYHKYKEKPPWWMLWKEDIYNHVDFILRSPTSGLIINSEWIRCRDKNAQHVYTGLIHKNLVPILLIPQHEPELGSSRLQNIANGICRSISQNWRYNVHFCGSCNGGVRRRLGNISNSVFNDGCMDNFENNLSDATNWCADYMKNNTENIIIWNPIEYNKLKNEIKNGYVKSRDLDSGIENLRAIDYQLRDQLAHLIHKVGK